ncbi:putative manganese-dependent inorganic diphosphatase [Treponema sp.]|uniref:putative manganese-dependent inorganic diphosphatase n=1 Tax=Treponema sp. TaxID=166 RepID=UPI00298E8C51|nr:putative manganese-dependent inorganic diphosphatase [Treponema sp.]MCR5614421.1 putative manganese-dependent inorganic diphosphatase [Treponema sp.]
MEKTVYVIGHRNPDTDAVAAAVGYAALKNLMGFTNYKAARAGHLNPQTAYIFEKFGLKRPEYISDLVPKVKYYMPKDFQTVDEHVAVWDALGRMESSGLRVLPVVDQDGKYKSLLHYSGFAQSILTVLNPEKPRPLCTSISLIQKTLNAQPVIVNDNASEIKKYSIMVGSSSLESFEQRLKSHASENIVVIASNREDLLKLTIENNVKLLILTSGFSLNKELRKLAQEHGVSVIISPYRTSPTSMLIAYSMPVSEIGDKDIIPVHPNDTISKIQSTLKNSPCRYLPVVDEENCVKGIISEHDLTLEPNVELILVDHNEMSQAVNGIENYKIVEVIDHHRIGTLSTKYPITFINKPVGSTSTLITSLFRENRVSIPKDVASLLLCGILSDTLILQSATTTDFDRDIAEYLSSITNLDVKELGNEILLAGSRVSGRKADELIHQDMKEYNEGKISYTISQIEVGNTKEILDRKSEFLSELQLERKNQKLLFTGLLVTDITQLSSILLLDADDAFKQFITFPKLEENVYYLQGVVSRKKQLVPLITEQVTNYQR